MKLYKNVDVCDLESIVQQGLLSIDECGNDNWDDGKRAKNPTNVVYLFSPKDRRHNSFVGYGIALLEVECEDAKPSEMLSKDVHRDDYDEYTVSKVEPKAIHAIYIPDIFKSRIELPPEVMKKVKWCGISAREVDKSWIAPPWDGKIYDPPMIDCTTERLQRMANACGINTGNELYLRGLEEDGRTIFDISDVSYII